MTSAISKTLKRSALALTIALGFAVSANAQQASGNITGEAAAGDIVIVHGAATGFHREITVEKAGKYNMRAIPPGSYTVAVKHADGTEIAPKPIAVRGGGATVRVK
jgi:hypothetical protein